MPFCLCLIYVKLLRKCHVRGRSSPFLFLVGFGGWGLALGARRSADLAGFGALAEVMAAEVMTLVWDFVPCLQLCGGVVCFGLTVEFLGVVLEQLLSAYF